MTAGSFASWKQHAHNASGKNESQGTKQLKPESIDVIGQTRLNTHPTMHYRRTHDNTSLLLTDSCFKAFHVTYSPRCEKKDRHLCMHERCTTLSTLLSLSSGNYYNLRSQSQCHPRWCSTMGAATSNIRDLPHQRAFRFRTRTSG
jgi:hypothetical protein